MTLVIYGDVGERGLKELGESIREEIAVLPDVGVVQLNTPRDYELNIEIQNRPFVNTTWASKKWLMPYAGSQLTCRREKSATPAVILWFKVANRLIAPKSVNSWLLEKVSRALNY
jgi:hypothetical protein